MPEMDGFETAALIRNHTKTRSTPIVFVTGLSKNDEQILAAYKLGAVDYLLKPVNIDCKEVLSDYSILG